MNAVILTGGGAKIGKLKGMKKSWTKAGGNHLGPSRRNLLKRYQ